MEAIQTAKIDKLLGNFSDKLVPNEEYIENGKAVVEKVFNLLRSKSKFPIDRVYIGGSGGKKTAVITADFDCIPFINNKKPPFAKVLEDFEDILTLATFPFITSIRSTPFSVQFKAGLSEEQLVDIDLLPASNMIIGGISNVHNHVAEQALKILRHIHDSEEESGDGHEWSSSLVESQLEFMKQQSQFIHQLVRLAKFWNKTIYLDPMSDHVSGRSTLIELVAVHAGQKEELIKPFGKRSLLSSFQTFLSTMPQLERIRIDFEFNPLEGLPNSSRDWNQLKSGRHFKEAHIIEPANPFNNLLHGLRDSIREKFKDFANESMRRLQLYYKLSLLADAIKLDEIFAPQPQQILPPEITEEWNMLRKGFAMISTTSNQNVLNPTMIVRRDDKIKSKISKIYLKHIQDCLTTTIHAFVNSVGENAIAGPPINSGSSRSTNTNHAPTSAEMRERIQKCYENNLRGATSTWSTSTEPDENYDVTFIIPYDGTSEKNFAVVSFRWDDYSD